MKTNILMFGILFFLATIVLGAGYLLIFPLEIAKPNVQPYKIITPVVKSGGEVTYLADICKFEGRAATVIRSIVTVDKTGTAYPSITGFSNLPKGCNKTYVKVPVPSFVPPGNYYLQLDVEYKINILKTINYHFRTDNFQVTN